MARMFEIEEFNVHIVLDATSLDYRHHIIPAAPTAAQGVTEACYSRHPPHKVCRTPIPQVHSSYK